MTARRLQSRRSRSIAIVDLFAGAGGSALGAALAGGDVRLSVEIDRTACDTLRRNPSRHCGSVVEADVSDLSGMDLRHLAAVGTRDPLIVIGGPPCQPFSKAAYWTDPGDDSRYQRARTKGVVAERPAPITRAKRDSRRDLVAEFARLVIESKADGFMFENVPSILHPRNKPTFKRFLRTLTAAGYSVVSGEVNSAAFGVPQLRRRVVALGLRHGTISLPNATHALPDVEPNGLLPCVSTGDALDGMGDPRFAEPEEVVTGRWAAALREIPPGMNYKALTAWAGHPRPLFEAETRFWSFLLKLDPKRPSWTVAATPGPWVGPFHWATRRLRTPELAALQSFPKDYVFQGIRRERVRQIGNAMPPLLAAPMVRSLLERL